MFGWFARKPTKATAQGHKRVVVGGMAFTIKRLSPLVDFQPNSTPMIFADSTRAQKVDVSTPVLAKKFQEDMYAVVQAGVVDPPLAAPGKPDLNVADIFRDPEVGYKLYVHIVEHSLLRFSGVRRPIFLAVRLLLRFTTWLGRMGSARATSPTTGSHSA